MVLEKNVKNKMERWNNEVFQKAKEDRLLLQILKNRRRSWICHTIRHNKFVINILEHTSSSVREGPIYRTKAVRRPRP